MDREKVINELVKHIESALNVDSDYVDCVRTDLLQYTVALLKEQETQKFFVDESGKIIPLPIVVRCKDCKHNTSSPHNPVCELDVYRSGGVDWFCADGERVGT